VQEPASLSPTPLRRRDSLKSNQQHETIREEPKAKPVESKKEKKPELATPTPKRTSTVFGQYIFYMTFSAYSMTFFRPRFQISASERNFHA